MSLLGHAFGKVGRPSSLAFTTGRDGVLVWLSIPSPWARG